ncbi:MAG: BatA domain-containing protein, partial [Candidatus Latescibacteria bacterium]|nr:BatA domain-containing protein [Candidatus Latescibacterota bacterium]
MFGLSFSNPSVLHGLWAALLPLAIHLLNRRRALTVPFSNVALLQTLQYDRLRRIKLRQILLLLLRTLLIVLLVLAFARPALMGVGAGRAGGTVRSTAVLLLDRSTSMRHRTPDGSLYERSARALGRALDLFDPRDLVRVVLVDDRAVSLEAADASGLKARSEGLEPTYRGTDFQAGLEAAIETLAQTGTLNRELYVFSDFARNGWASLPDTLSSLEGLSIYLVSSRPEQVDNLGINGARPVGQMLATGSAGTLEVELANHGEIPKAEVPLQVYLGGRRIAQHLASVRGRDTGRFYVRFTPESTGLVPLRLELGGDDLAADNVYTSVLSIPEQVSALLVGDSSEETYYIERALSAAADARGTVSWSRLRPRDLTTESIAEVDVVFLCNVASLARGQLTALKRRVSAGAGLMICLGDRTDVRHYNTHLLPALLPSSLNGVVGTPRRTETHHTLRVPFPSHPLFLGLAQGEPARGPRFFAHYRVRPNAGTQPVLS